MNSNIIFNIALIILFVFAIFSALLCFLEFQKLNESIKEHGCREFCRDVYDLKMLYKNESFNFENLRIEKQS